MSQPPQPLTSYLTHSSWYHVLALLAAQQLKRSPKQTKEALITALAHHLLQPSVVAASIAQLDTVGKGALRALLAAAGALPVYTFEEHFGPIRPYRP